MLSPTLFIAVMDSLLSYLESSGLGVSVSGLNVGSSAHSADIRAASIDIDAMRTQGNLVDHFCKENSLKLNATKTKLVKFSHKKPDPILHVIAGQEIKVQGNAKCLGTWWRYDLSPTTKRAFFALRSIGTFQGKLNPLTGRSLYETFVVPILLYGCETWILSESYLAALESCKAEIGKRIFGLYKFHSNLSTLIGLHWPSVRSRVLAHKLVFLAKLLCNEEEKLSAQVLRTLACEDLYSISLIHQCRSIEHHFGTNYLQSFLQNPDAALTTLKVAKKHILNKDWKLTLSLASSHPSLAVVTSSRSVASSWNSFWDEALEYGVRGTRLMQNLFNSLSRPIFVTDLVLTVKSISTLTLCF